MEAVDHSMLSLLVVSALFIFSHICWMAHAQKLVNKLMSRDYTEFKNAEIKENVVRPHRIHDEGTQDDFSMVNDMVL